MRNLILISIVLSLTLTHSMFAMDVEPISEKTYNHPNQAELDRQLMDAVDSFDADLGKVEQLLKEGANPNGGQFKYYEDNPLIMIATDRPMALELCELLLRYGAHVDAPNKEGNSTPLLEASIRGYTDIAKILLEHKADPNWKPKDKKEFSALWHACKLQGNEELVKVLIEHKADVNDQNNVIQESPLIVATRGRSKIEICQMLLDNKANIRAIDNAGYTALIMASGNRNVDICKLLVDAAKKPSIIAFLGCLKHFNRTNLNHIAYIKTLHSNRKDLFGHHLLNGKPLELLRMKTKQCRTAYSVSGFEFLNPGFTSPDTDTSDNQIIASDTSVVKIDNNNNE